MIKMILMLNNIIDNYSIILCICFLLKSIIFMIYSEYFNIISTKNLKYYITNFISNCSLSDIKLYDQKYIIDLEL